MGLLIAARAAVENIAASSLLITGCQPFDLILG